MNRLFWVLAVLCLVAGLAACAGGSAPESEEDAQSALVPEEPTIELPQEAPVEVEGEFPILIPEAPAEESPPLEDDSLLLELDITEDVPLDVPTAPAGPADFGSFGGGAPVTGVAPRSPIEGLVQNEQDGIKVSAVILERRALLSGGSVPVTVTIENTGESSILYVQGSGSYTTPQALSGVSEHLAYVLPEDNLGMATMDYVTKELKPGESLNFKVFFMAIEPSENFNKYTQEQFFNNSLYIPNMAWQDIKEEYPDLAATKAGSYEANIYFAYSPQGEGPAAFITTGPTAYAQASLLVGIS